MLNIPPIYFYLPKNKIPHPFPDDVNEIAPTDGASTWILNTYIRLKQVNFPCQLVSVIPSEGILIIHRESLDYNFKPNPNLLLVCIKGDQNSHPYSHLEIVQNLAEMKAPSFQIQSVEEDRYLLPSKRYYMPHWVQPGLIPRNSLKGETFKNIAYFGITYNLAPELRTENWQNQLQELGLNWRKETRGNYWNNYNEVDVILAVRSFDGKTDYPWKPATKLYQAWVAQTPAILGVESAFRSERKSELDYLEVTSYEETILAVKKLQDKPKLYQAMVENGKIRAKEVSSEAITKKWIDFFENVSIPEYEKWCNLADFHKQKYFLNRYLALKFSGIQRKIINFTHKRG